MWDSDIHQVETLNLHTLGKTEISWATVGCLRPTSATFEAIFEGYNLEAHQKIGILQEEGRKTPTTRQPRAF